MNNPHEPHEPNERDSPFPGFFPFEEEWSIYFFGREQERKIILANLLTRRLTLLYGPSGVGKSSLINAGVAADLRHTSESRPISRHAKVSVQANAPLKSLDFVGTSVVSDPLLIIFKEWFGDPLASLLCLIRQSLAERFGEDFASDIEGLKLTETLRYVIRKARGTDVLIILDQFEEYFVHHPNDTGVGGFADEFSRAVVNLQLGVNFLISIREDWLARLDRFKGDIPNLFGNSIRIEHLTRSAAREAVVKPIDVYNELFEDERPKVDCRKEFVEKLLDQLIKLDNTNDERVLQPAEVPAEALIQGPHLQMVMQHFWSQIEDSSNPVLDEKRLADSGTVKRIIDSHLKTYLKHLSWRERPLAANVIRFLVAESGVKSASTAEGLAQRISTKTELEDEHTLTRIQELLEKLTRSKLLIRVTSPPPGDTRSRYQLPSDVLANPLIKWSQEVRAERKQATRALVFAVIVLFVALIVLLLAWGKKSAEAQQRSQEENARIQAALNLIRIQDERIPYSKAVLRGHSAPVTSAVFTHDNRILTASSDGTAIIWNIDRKEPATTLREPGALILAKFRPRGSKTVVTANVDGALTLWDLDKNQNLQLRPKDSHHITDVSFSPDGNMIVAASTVGEVFAWDANTGSPIKVTPATGKPIRQVGFSPSGKYLALASDDHTIRLWNGHDLNEIKVLYGHTDNVNGVAFSPKEDLLATASKDTTVRIWNLSDFSANILKGHAEGVNSVDFNSDGTQLLTTSDDTTARVWNVATRASIELIGHNDKVFSGSFSPDGSRAVTASKDTIVRIWHVGTGKSLFELKGHLGEVTYVTYSDDGHFIVTASSDATARVWSVPDRESFSIANPVLSALNPQYYGPCPTTISFIGTITALKGTGPVIYRFKGTNQRVSPDRTIFFDKPGVKSVGWYARAVSDLDGSQTLEIVEPKGLDPAKAEFTVKCTSSNGSPPPQVSPTTTPSVSPSQ